MSNGTTINVELTRNQIKSLIEAARSAAEIYRDSDDTPAEFHLQAKARSLEQAIVRLEKVDAEIGEFVSAWRGIQ